MPKGKKNKAPEDLHLNTYIKIIYCVVHIPYFIFQNIANYLETHKEHEGRCRVCMGHKLGIKHTFTLGAVKSYQSRAWCRKFNVNLSIFCINNRKDEGTRLGSNKSIINFTRLF